MSKSSNLLLRVVAVVILLATTTFLPWWISMILVGLHALVFRFFLEGVLIGWLIDTSFAIHWIPWVSIGILVYIIIVEVVMYYISH